MEQAHSSAVVATCPGPKQRRRRGTAGLGRGWELFSPLHQTLLICKTSKSAYAEEREARSPIFLFPIFSSTSLPPSTAACICSKYHPSHQQRGQPRKQPGAEMLVLQ